MICRICNIEVGSKGFPKHIKYLHNINYFKYVEQFIDKFPNDFMFWKRCVNCGKICKQRKTCCMKCSNIVRSNVLKGKKPVNMKNWEEIKKRISQSKIGKKQSLETIKKRLKFKQTGPEMIVSDFLKNNHIPFYYQYFINYGNSIKSYDFKIKGKNILIETDGDYWHGNPNSKYKFKYFEQVKENDYIKTKLAEEKGFKLIRFWESDIKNNPFILNKILDF